MWDALKEREKKLKDIIVELLRKKEIVEKGVDSEEKQLETDWMSESGGERTSCWFSQERNNRKINKLE